MFCHPAHTYWGPPFGKPLYRPWGQSARNPADIREHGNRQSTPRNAEYQGTIQTVTWVRKPGDEVEVKGLVVILEIVVQEGLWELGSLSSIYGLCLLNQNIHHSLDVKDHLTLTCHCVVVSFWVRLRGKHFPSSIEAHSPSARMKLLLCLFYGRKCM